MENDHLENAKVDGTWGPLFLIFINAYSGFLHLFFPRICLSLIMIRPNRFFFHRMIKKRTTEHLEYQK